MVKTKKVKKNISKADMQKKTSESAKKPVASKPKKAAKPVKAEVSPKAGSEKVSKKKDYTGLIASIAAIVAVVLIAYFLINLDPSESNEGTMNESVQGNIVLATVNGEPITQSEIDVIYSRIPDQNKAQFTKESLLEQLVTEKLLLQEADKKNLNVSEEEIDEFVQLILLTNQLSPEQLDQRLMEQGLTAEDLREEIKKQVLLTKLVNQEIEVTNMSDEELKAYYEDNIEFFIASPEMVNASHILICYDESMGGCTENRTKEEALIRANNISSMIADDNFAEIAMEYSDGPSAPRGGNLGYFSRGQMVLEFEEIAFSIGVGEVSEPVLTQFGYHIIKVYDKQNETIASFEEVKESIKNQLEQDERQSRFQDYVDELTANSDIEYN